VKKSAIWTTAAIAAVGFGVPAFAAIAAPGPIRQIAPTPVVSVDKPDNTIVSISPDTIVTLASLPDDTVNSTASSVEDISGNCDEAEHANDAACVGVNAPGVTEVSTPNSVEDVSGNCDEAEHATDPNCTGSGTAVDDNSGPGSDDSGHNATDDNSGRGSGGSDDSGHGSNDG
jgi:hypothetical protein